MTKSPSALRHPAPTAPHRPGGHLVPTVPGRPTPTATSTGACAWVTCPWRRCWPTPARPPTSTTWTPSPPPTGGWRPPSSHWARGSCTRSRPTPAWPCSPPWPGWGPAAAVQRRELVQVLRAGGDPEACVFAGVGKTTEELALAVGRGVTVHVESADEAPTPWRRWRPGWSGRPGSRSASTPTSRSTPTSTSRPATTRPSSASQSRSPTSC